MPLYIHCWLTFESCSPGQALSGTFHTDPEQTWHTAPSPLQLTACQHCLLPSHVPALIWGHWTTGGGMAPSKGKQRLSIRKHFITTRALRHWKVSAGGGRSPIFHTINNQRKKGHRSVPMQAGQHLSESVDASEIQNKKVSHTRQQSNAGLLVKTTLLQITQEHISKWLGIVSNLQQSVRSESSFPILLCHSMYEASSDSSGLEPWCCSTRQLPCSRAALLGAICNAHQQPPLEWQPENKPRLWQLKEFRIFLLLTLKFTFTGPCRKSWGIKNDSWTGTTPWDAIKPLLLRLATTIPLLFLFALGSATRTHSQQHSLLVTIWVQTLCKQEQFKYSPAKYLLGLAIFLLF